MGNSPLISIALCTYNASKYLEKQIFSIFAQTYKNIEIIVVDDCSTDGTYEYLQNIKEKYKQLKLYRNKHNLGFNKNFEKAIGFCKGNFIAISDQDDIWLPEKLEILINNIDKNWLIFSNSELIDSNDKPIGSQLLKSHFEIKNRTFKGIILNNFVTGHTILFSKEFVDYFMPIPSTGYYDWWMGFVAYYHDKITYINKCLTLHRVHDASVIGNINNSGKENLKKTISFDLATQLMLFASYKNLVPKDREIIKKLSNAYNKKFSLYLIYLIVFQYSIYLPYQKPRNWMGRFFFSLKFK
jgi:glycosyltransferase involved in cell wall biosynthesis